MKLKCGTFWRQSEASIDIGLIPAISIGKLSIAGKTSFCKSEGASNERRQSKSSKGAGITTDRCWRSIIGFVWGKSQLFQSTSSVVPNKFVAKTMSEAELYVYWEGPWLFPTCPDLSSPIEILPDWKRWNREAWGTPVLGWKVRLKRTFAFKGNGTSAWIDWSLLQPPRC